MRGDDPEVRLELAQLLQTDSGQAHTTEALEHYRAAMTVMRRRQQDIRPEVHSNVAVLYHRIGKFSRAEKSMIKALSVEEEGVDNAFPEFFKQEEGSESATQGTASTDNVVADLEPTMAVTANQVTAAYNLGLVYEALSRWGRAQFLYRSILKAFPGYSDAWLRLAVLARDSSQIEVAKQYFAEAAVQIAADAAPRLTRGWPLHFARGSASLDEAGLLPLRLTLVALRLAHVEPVVWSA